MEKALTKEQVEFVAERLIRNALDAVQESKNNVGDDFYKGRKFAYYEMLDTLKNQLIVYDQDLREYGLDMNLEEALH